MKRFLCNVIEIVFIGVMLCLWPLYKAHCWLEEGR